VLVAEDDAAIRWLVGAVLEEAGFYPVLVEDGQRALELLGHVRPVLAVVDQKMPRLDGLELIRRVRARPEHLPVVAMSAAVNRTAALEAGADLFVAKPFDLDDLVAAVRRALGGTGAAAPA
jgi:DNA-binding response OmpR family regulator